MKALVVIDIQNDYFEGGKLPLEGADDALRHALRLIQRARDRGDLVVVVQHLAPAGSPFLEEGSRGGELHQAIQAVTKNDPLVIKHEADSFLRTNLGDLLRQHNVDAVELLGMMTQHCVTHTALSPEALDFSVAVHADACAAPTRDLSSIAISGLAARHTLI